MATRPRKRAATVRIAVLALLSSVTAAAQLSVVSDREPSRVFGAGARRIDLVWQNESDAPCECDLRERVFQATSSSAVLWRDDSAGTIRMLGRQRAIERAVIAFPAVKAPTRFFVQWLISRKVVGTTDVYVYPENLLQPLRSLAGDAPVGLFDPKKKAATVLQAAGIPCVELAAHQLDDFSGRLAIVLPPQSMPRAEQSAYVKGMAARNIAVVWAAEPDANIVPSFYRVTTHGGPVVVVRPDALANFGDRPEAQLALLACVRLATGGDRLPLP